ncbi:tau 95 subunit of transcription factor TFIIIC [Rhinocladiella similis]
MSHPRRDTPSTHRHRVPSTPVISLEHPCIVHNPDKAIQMVGGSSEIAQALNIDGDKTLGLSFQPDNQDSRTVVSYNKKTDNLLLKLTVPKRTGRKRKRGSDDAFIEHVPEDTRKDVAYLLRSLHDNPKTYEAKVVGKVRSTHIWRTMPDLVYSTRDSQFLRGVRSKVIPQDYPLVKQWSLPESYGLQNTEIFPPGILSTQTLPANYMYRQNPAVKTVSDPETGKKSLFNTQAPQRLYTYQCQWDDEKFPDQPNPECPPLQNYPESHIQLYGLIQRLFDQRPLWTRRALINQFPEDAPIFAARYIISYVAYAIRSGPWRDTFCKLGLDPRKDRSYRKYQTVMMQLLHSGEGFDRSWARSKDKSSHIFTGTPPYPTDGKLWQLCDLEDPDLKSLVNTPEINLRHECELRYFGWYSNGTMAKIRIALKAKSDALINHESLDPTAMQNFLTLPDYWEGMGMADSSDQIRTSMGFLGKNASKKELEWAAAYRSLCRTIAGSVPTSGGSGKGRLSKSKPATTSSYLEAGQTPLSEEPHIPQGYEEPEDDDEDDLEEGQEGDD